MTANRQPSRLAAWSASDSSPPTIHSTSNLKRLVERLAQRPKASLLDLGCLCSQNIEWMIEQGFRVTVDDRLFETTLTEGEESESSDDEPSVLRVAPLCMLNYPPEAFDAILCWDFFDYLNPPDARISLSNLSGLLRPKGMIFAFFKGPQQGATAPVRYRIMQENHLRYEAVDLAIPRARVYQNREVHELFQNFDTINSCILKNQMREVLVQKKPAGN